MITTKLRARKVAALAAGPIAIVIAGTMVWQGSQAAFTTTTRNAGNSWSAGKVTLTDDDAGAAAFTVKGLVPGQSGEKCIVVTSNSDVSGEVRTYVQNLAKSTHGLENYIKVNLDMGTGGSFDDCTGFTAGQQPIAGVPISLLAQNKVDYANSTTSWVTTGTSGESKSYKVSWNFDDKKTDGATMTPEEVNALQGDTFSIDMVWELQSPKPPTTTVAPTTTAPTP